MRALLVSVGTLGDTLPFLLIGRELLRRGHRVTLLGSAAFESLATSAGLDFDAIVSREDHEQAMQLRAGWHDWRRALNEGLGLIVKEIVPTYQAIARHVEPGATVVAATGIMLGARVAQDHLGVPLATIHLQPGALRGDRESHLGNWKPPRMVVRLRYRVIDWVADRHMAPELNRLRASLGLKPVRRVVDEWWNSPQLTIGAFPSWLAPSRDAWPRHFHFTGFPLDMDPQPYDEEPRLESFLAAGEPPLVFSATSAFHTDDSWIDTACEVVRGMNRRGVILVPRGTALPTSAPPGVIAIRYAPHDRFLPRAAALIHNGGIGTSAAALRAGIPQVIVPRIVDQPDNARRLQRLGVARVVSPRQANAARLVQTLDQLLSDPGVVQCCHRWQERSRDERSVETIASSLEQLLSMPAPAVPTSALKSAR